MRRLSEVIFRGISLTIVAASLGVSGCAASSDQEPAPSVSWEERKIHDAVTIDVPDGWVLVDKENRPPSYDLVVAPNLDRSPPVGVWIKNYRADIGIMHGPDVDMKARRDQNMADAEKRGTDSFIEPLGLARSVGRRRGDTRAWGKSLGRKASCFRIRHGLCGVRMGCGGSR